jgi:hypothetical protein
MLFWIFVTLAVITALGAFINAMSRNTAMTIYSFAAVAAWIYLAHSFA